MTTHKIIPIALFSLSIAVSMALATPAMADLIYVSSSSAGTVDGLSFEDEDIIVLDTDSGFWSMYFDGSAVGLASKTDVDAIAIQDPDTILMSFQSSTSVPGVGTVTSADIVEYDTGNWSLYFDGSDVGFSSKNDNVDAIGLDASGGLVISLASNFQIAGLEGMDEDLVTFTATALGSTTAGTFQLYFDGSETAFNKPNEDINGVSLDPFSGEVFVTVKRKFTVDGAKGDGLDIVSCDPLNTNINPISACNSPMSIIFDGSEIGLSSKTVDGIFILSDN